MAPVRVLDIRQEAEFRSGHVPGALHIELGAVPSWRALAVGVYRLWRDLGFAVGASSPASSPTPSGSV